MSWEWLTLQCALDGVKPPERHAVLTYQGSWSAPGTGYASIVAQSSGEQCYEVPSDEPSAFGLLSGITAPSYKQSGVIALDWTEAWLAAHPTQTFALGGYSQGGEDAARACIELMPGGRFEKYAANFVGGYTYGNPSRGLGFHAPRIADPGPYQGISPVKMTKLPWKVDGRLVWSATQPAGGVQLWADWVHSKANGDAGMDMYPCVPVGQVGDDMTDVYLIATDQQLNEPITFVTDMVKDLMKVVNDLGILPKLTGGLPGLLELAPEMLIEFLLGLIGVGGGIETATGPDAALLAAVQGLNFISAPGGPTAPHVTYAGEVAGYSDLVTPGIGFLRMICSLTPAHS